MRVVRNCDMTDDYSENKREHVYVQAKQTYLNRHTQNKDKIKLFLPKSEPDKIISKE